MKLKKLRKKIQQLEKRLREDPQKLAKLKRRLQEAESRQALKAARKSAARATANRKDASGPVKKAKKKLNLSPGTSCATFGSDESQVGCKESCCGE